jgi:hypothetical protein
MMKMRHQDLKTLIGLGVTPVSPEGREGCGCSRHIDFDFNNVDYKIISVSL